MNTFSTLPGGSKLTGEQEALLAMFLEKEGIEELEDDERKPVIELKPEDRFKPFPLTDIQLAYVIGRENSALGMSDVSSHAYFELETRNLDVSRYEQAWIKLLKKHDMMRCVILPNGQQQVLPEAPEWHLAYYDLSKLTPEAKTGQIEQIRDKLGQPVKNVDEWPMFDIYVTRLDEETFRIHLSLEGLFGDVQSLNTMLTETKRFYENPDLSTAPLELTFRDYVLSLENRRNLDSYHQAKKYWQERIPHLAPAPAMPVFSEQDIRQRPRVKRFAGGLDVNDWSNLKSIAHARNLSPTSILLAAFAEVLRLWNREADFCLNLTLFNRLPLHPQIEELIGDFTDTLLLEAKAAPDKSFAWRAQALRDRLWSDLDNRQFGGLDVLRELNRYRSEKDQQYMPVVFTSAFLMGDYSNALTTMTLDGNPVDVVFSASQTPQLLIDHQVFEDRGRLGIHWDCRSEYFQSGYLDALFLAFTDLLTRLAREENLWEQKEVVRLPPSQIEARKRYNDTSTSLPDGLLQSGFLKIAASQPELPALICRDGTISYGRLAELTAGVAIALEGRTAPDELVAIAMHKGWEQIVAALGILCAGAAYLPVDPDQPDERLAQILYDAGVRILLTTSNLQARSWPEGIETIAVDSLPPGDADALYTQKPLQTRDNLAYVIYTSGSTGAPKGVMIEHGAVVNTIADINNRFRISAADRIMALASLSFDLSVWDIFGALSAGAAIVIPEPADEREPARWLDLVEKNGVTVWNTVPAMMQMLVEYREAAGRTAKGSIRLALLSGDWLPLDLPNRIKNAFPATIISLGGATEASIWSIFHQVEKVDKAWKSIPYGRPLANQKIHVLNQFLQSCPDWVPGSLYIGGAGLARGYWHDPQKTSAAFTVHPQTGERIYKTGDIGYFHPDGHIVLLGREDNQCKINGFRVEPGEVEHALRAHPGIREACAIPVHGETSSLKCFLVPTDDSSDLFTALFRNSDTLWKDIKELDRETNQQDAATVNDVFNRLEHLYDDAIQALVHELALFVNPGDTATAEECVRKARISPRYLKWMRRTLANLAEWGFLAKNGDSYTCVRPVEIRTFAEIQEKYQDQKVTGFMLMSAVRLADILREKLHSAELYAMPAAKSVYPAMFKSSNAILGNCMKLLQQYSEGHLSILEVGSGHGGTTASLLKSLSPQNVTYYFTDISTYFLQNAAENFKNYPFVHYKLYNLDNPPASQGLEPHSFDAIVASSVLHDTKSLDSTLASLFSLLKPGGMLFIVEQTRFLRWYDIGMGLQQGFDVFEDTELRLNHPLVSAEQWRSKLLHAGFAEAHVFDKLDARFALGMDLIVARSPDKVKVFNPDSIKSFLKKRLPGYMIPSEYFILPALPMSRTGKIDRKAMKEMGIALAPQKTSSGLHTPTEKKLAAIWRDLLMHEDLGFKDNFFELGGDSLLATVLIGKVRETFNVELSVLEIYTIATLEDMARHIDNPQHGQDGVAMIQTEGDNPPWFCIPGAEGSLHTFAEMSAALKGRTPLYGAIPAGMDGKTVPLTRIDDMAAAHLRNLRKLLPHGPYKLAGFCMGGFVAYEMAVQLEKAGTPAQSLFMIDSHLLPRDVYADEIRSLCIYAGLFGVPMSLVEGAADDPRLNPLCGMTHAAHDQEPVIGLEDLKKTDRDTRLPLLYRRVRQAGYLEGMSEKSFKNGYAVLLANLEAMHAYKPAPLRTPVVFFRAQDNPAGGMDPIPYWSQNCRLTCHDLPGNHLTIMGGESLQQILKHAGE